MRPLENYDTWQGSIRNYAWLLGGNLPGATDLDFLAERHGRFLLLEGKPALDEAVYLTLGQAIALRALAKLEQFTVWLIGEPPDGVRVGAYFMPIEPDTKGSWRDQRRGLAFTLDRFEELTVAQLRERASTWWTQAGEPEAA